MLLSQPGKFKFYTRYLPVYNITFRVYICNMTCTNPLHKFKIKNKKIPAILNIAELIPALFNQILTFCPLTVSCVPSENRKQTRKTVSFLV